MLNFRLLWNFISCTFEHPKNLPLVYLPHLQNKDGTRKIIEPCNVMFFHGHALPVNKLIQYYIDCAINHVAMFIGGKKTLQGQYIYNVFHAVGKGVTIEPLQTAWADSDKYILVYEYIKDGKRLTFKQRDGIIETANEIYKNRTAYAVPELFELAVMSKLGRERAPYGTRKAIDSAFGVLNDVLEGRSEPCTCGELIDRCFAKSAPLGYLPNDFQRSFRETEDDMLLLLSELKYDFEKDFITPADQYLRCPLLVPKGILVKEF